MPVPSPRQHTLYRGDAAVKPEIVETYRFGNSTVQIASNCFVKTEEEKQKVLEAYHDAGWRIIEELVRNGEAV